MIYRYCNLLLFDFNPFVMYCNGVLTAFDLIMILNLNVCMYMSLLYV